MSPELSAVQSGNPKDRVGARKPSVHLIPAAAEIAESIVMALGAKKYGPFNWRREKVRASIYVAAARRHEAATALAGTEARRRNCVDAHDSIASEERETLLGSRDPHVERPHVRRSSTLHCEYG